MSLLLVGTVLVFAGGVMIYAGTADYRELEELNKNIAERQQSNADIQAYLAYYEPLQEKIGNAKAKIAESEQNFSSGGMIIQEGYCKAEFKNSKDKLEKAYEGITSAVNELNNEIEKNNQAIKNYEARKKEVQASIDAKKNNNHQPGDNVSI